MRRISVLLAVLVMVVAACGDDNGVLGGSSTTAAPTATAGGGATTTTEAATATTAPPDLPGDGSSGGIQAAFDAYETSAMKVVYRMGQGGDEQILTIARDPNLDPPVAATLIGPDGEEGRFLSLGERTIICGPPGQECIEFPPELGMGMGETLLGPLVSGFLLNEDVASSPGFSVEETTATVAGRQGLCFTFTPAAFVTDADVEFIRQCVDAEFGFVLLIDYVATGGAVVENVMELLEFGLPTPDDFEPSGPLTTMPTG